MVRVDLPSNVMVRSGWDRTVADLDALEQGEAEGSGDIMDDFVGSIEVRSAGSKGRGLITTQSVAAGEVLLKEHAFATAARVSQSTNLQPHFPSSSLSLPSPTPGRHQLHGGVGRR